MLWFVNFLHVSIAWLRLCHPKFHKVTNGVCHFQLARKQTRPFNSGSLFAYICNAPSTFCSSSTCRSSHFQTRGLPCSCCQANGAVPRPGTEGRPKNRQEPHLYFLGCSEDRKMPSIPRSSSSSSTGQRVIGGVSVNCRFGRTGVRIVSATV